MTAFAYLPLRRSARPGLLPINPVPYLPNIGCFCGCASEKIAIALVAFGRSGVSSPSAMSPGDESIPEASEKRSGSKFPLRGVVKEGFRNCGAGFDVLARNELVVGGGLNPPG